MIYAYDNWAQMPSVDLYDTLMMAMALNAAKDMYEKGEQRIKDFKKEYGDFMTPIMKDLEWYNNDFYGKIVNGINSIYARGGDPLRNAQDRGQMMMLINNLPYGEYAKKRVRAENAKEWYKNMGALRAADKYNEDFSRFLMETPDQWDENDPGISSPTQFQTLKAATNDWYNNRSLRSATAKEKIAMGLDPRYDYKLFTDDDLMNIARDQTPGWNGSAAARYYRHLAEQQVAAKGLPYTLADVEALLLRNIASSLQEWLSGPVRDKVDEFAKMAQEHAYEVDMFNRNAALLKELAQIKASGKENGPDGGYSATTNMAADAEGTLMGQIATYDNSNKSNLVDKEIESIAKRFADMAIHPDRYDNWSKKYITGRALELGLLSGDKRIVDGIAATKKISIGMEGVAREVSKLADKKSSFWSITGGSYEVDRLRVNGMNRILHDLSSKGAMTTINEILKNFANLEDDGGFSLGSAYDRLTGIGNVMEDVLSKGYNDGKKHSDIDKAISHLKGKGSLSKYRNSWTASEFDSMNNTNDWFPDRKVYATGNVIAGDKYYYIEVSNDPTDHDESAWFKIERDKVRNGGINPVLSSITQQVDDKFLHDYSHTNVLGNEQGVVQKYNK